MKMFPFWRYFGGKWRAAPRYPAPRFRTVIEPFAGAAGYSLRYPSRDVILVEKYPVVAEIWRFLIGASSAEISAIPLVEHVDELPSGTPDGARHLVGFTLNAATVSPCKQLSKGRRELREMGREFEGWSEAMRARVARQVERIRHWKIIEGDFTEAPDVEATWFVDPPYQTQGIHYVHGSDAIDYVALAAWCRARRGQTMVCENAGATWLPFRRFADFKASPMSRKGGKSSEVVWMSGETQLEIAV